MNMLAPVVLLSSIYVIVLAQSNANDPIWGWQMRQAGPGTVGHYFVKLPQSEQQVQYIADGSGYHSALKVTTNDPQHQHSTSIALGEKAVELSGQTPAQSYDLPILNQSQNSYQNPGQNPMGLYFLQQYPFQSTYPQITSNSQNFMQYSSIPNYYYSDSPTPYYNIQRNNQENSVSKYGLKGHKNTDNSRNEASEEIIETKENGPVVVFKDHKCKNDQENQNYDQNIQKIHDIDAYNSNTNGNFGVRENKAIDTGNTNKIQEYQYSSIDHYSTLKPITFTQNEGISKLVASTQDLISNDDLLRINHAAETIVHYSDDLIKPRRQTNSRVSFKSNSNPRSRITVTGKIGKIVDSNVEHPSTLKDNKYESNNEYKFASPIIVEDYDYKNQIINNFVSSVGPYIDGGYNIVDITRNNNTYIEQSKSNEDLVNITPRPVSQHFLTPITVALRLINDNNTEILNTVDHEASDSEFVERTVERPRKGKTFVEIQESIPVDITHINDVEYHEYLDEGRSNKALNTKSFYQRYIQSIENGNKENNINEYQNSDKTAQNFKNTRSDQTQSNSDNDNTYYYNREDKNKIIQPIIIEKQVPITTYVDRYIEKPQSEVKNYETIVEKPVEVTKYVDKPYPVEVFKPYPVEVRVPYPVEHKIYVDRPVHVPFPVEKVIEKQMIHPYPVPTPVGIPVGFPIENRVIYPVPIETPVPVAVPVEKPITVEKVIEKKVPMPYPVEKRIPIPVEIPKPYPVDRIIEKKVPYPVHINRIVERKIPVQVPYPVKQIVEKIVEKPVVVTKFVDKPYPVEKRVPYPVDRIVERKVPYPVHIPYEVPYYIEKNIQKSEHPYQFEKNDKLTTLYSYGVSQEALQNVANYLKLNHEQYKERAIQQETEQAETKTNYQIQPANGHILNNIQNVTPVYTKLSKQYASSYNYNTTQPSNQQDFKYYGPVPVQNYDSNWEKNKEYTERLRRTERIPKVSDVRIEYGFKPPLIPSTEIDLNGVPIKKENSQ